MTDWNSASEPPSGRPGFWSGEVAVVTNLGNLFRISYFQGDYGGVWQRPKAFQEGEQVEWWLPLPK